MLSTFVYSDLAADPDLNELVEMFIQEMPDRIKALETQARSGDWQQLTRTAHQNQGQSGELRIQGDHALRRRLEEAGEARVVRSMRFSPGSASYLGLCRRVRCGLPPADDPACVCDCSECP